MAFGLNIKTGIEAVWAKITGVIRTASLFIDNIRVSPYQEFSFSYATSTPWTATTTLLLGSPFEAETFAYGQCFTDAGTLVVQIGDGTNKMEPWNASSTIGTQTLATNNSFTAQEKRYIDIGTPATSPTKISCTFKKYKQ